MKLKQPVLNDANKRQLKRRFRRRQRDAVGLTQAADQQIEQLLIKRFERLISVRRFVFLWIILFVLLFGCMVAQLRALSPYYQTLQPVPGGLYSEGLIGSFNNANPIYATDTVDTAVSRLVFSGLFKYDTSNKLVGDLASGWTLNNAQTRYTVHLKHGIKWQDGKDFTADDVVFTYQTIQTPSAQSSIYSNWQGIKVSKQDAYTVNFDLPNALSSFPYSMTNGIVPAHLLKKIPPEQLRTASFNVAPVGTGPFRWKFIEIKGTSPAETQQRITLEANGDYSAGRPKLDGISLITFSDDQHLTKAFEDKQLNAMSGLETVPSELAKDTNIQVYATPSTSEVMTFFNNSQALLSDANVRRALVSGVDRKQLVQGFQYPTRLADGPLLRGQLGYDPTVIQPPYNLDAAKKILNDDGWVPDAKGLRSKNGQPLVFSLSAQDTPVYTQTAQFLQKEWTKLGAKVDVHYYSADDLQSGLIANHSYDALLYGISIGVDPDVFAYWDSSQANISSQGHLNLSEYKSPVADQALEAGRTRSDPTLRTLKYKTFLEAWTQDTPALALYQPNSLYVSRGPVYNFERDAVNSKGDRFYNVSDWMIRQQKQTLQ